MLKRASGVVLTVIVVGCAGSNSSPTAPSPIQATTAFNLTGQVTDSITGTTISGATVSIADGPNAGRLATTDALGNYSLTSLQQSSFTVSASASNYTSQSKGVTLTSNEMLTFQLTGVSGLTYDNISIPRNTPLSDMKIQWRPSSVLFVDGTTIGDSSE
ncbi:MAG: carboxypeptidase regulatory-like domain-containing protein [Vicinamibacterales bacterium]